MLGRALFLLLQYANENILLDTACSFLEGNEDKAKKGETSEVERKRKRNKINKKRKRKRKRRKKKKKKRK